MEARLSLADTPAERLAAVREHRHRMLIIERRLGQMFLAGQTTSAATLTAKYYRLEAEQFLVEAGVDLSKEAPMVEPKPAPATPPPAPPDPPKPR